MEHLITIGMVFTYIALLFTVHHLIRKRAEYDSDDDI